MSAVETALINKYAAPVPRYTSYPTAPHFSPFFEVAQYLERLAGLPQGSDLSLYLHVPFCHELCWYCGCNTKAVRRYEPVGRYLFALEREIAEVARFVPRSHRVTAIHLGGGSPNILKPVHILQLAELLNAKYHVAGGAEIAVEIDPRNLSQPQVNAFGTMGVNRVSIGVQDFDERVQAAINRLQPFEMTQRAVDLFREAGVPSINVDLVYGLPYQTLDTVARTVDRVLQIAPDRIATFGYAHLPSRLKHQRLIDTGSLPPPVERFKLSALISSRLIAAGYVSIGLDHFAKPQDPLASRPLARNFQGYTTDRAPALIGLGASAIGRVGGAYVQNAVPTGEYIHRIEKDGIAVARGHVLTTDDEARAYAIERLMCDLSLSYSDVEARYGREAEQIKMEACLALAEDCDGFLEEISDGIKITDRGRPFVRSICARFDKYLQRGVAQHSSGV